MSIKKQLGYSGLTNTIVLAKMKNEGNGIKVKVSMDKGEDVTNECLQMSYKVVEREGGEVSWDLGNRVIHLKAYEELKK